MALVNALLFVIFLQLLLATFWGLDKDPSARFWFQAWCIPTLLILHLALERAEACKNFPFGWRPQDTRNLCRKVFLAEYAAEGRDEQIKKLFIEPEKNTPSKE